LDYSTRDRRRGVRRVYNAPRSRTVFYRGSDLHVPDVAVIGYDLRKKLFEGQDPLDRRFPWRISLSRLESARASQQTFPKSPHAWRIRLSCLTATYRKHHPRRRTFCWRRGGPCAYGGSFSDENRGRIAPRVRVPYSGTDIRLSTTRKLPARSVKSRVSRFADGRVS